MSWMSPRERVIAALSCKPTDIVPFDIGGTNVTTLNIHAYEKLKAYLGIEAPTQWSYYIGQVPDIPKEVLEFFNGDVRYVHCAYPSPMPEGLAKSVQVDEWGIEWTQGPTGLFYVSRSPLANADSLYDLTQYPWPDPSTLEPVESLAEAARKLRQETDYAICLNSSASIVHLSQNLRGYENWLMDTTVNVKFFESLMGYITDICLAAIEALMVAVNNNADLVLIADDFSTQSGPLISPTAYRKLIKPYHARILEAIRVNSSAKILFHSCGSTYWALGDLVDIGADGVNPIQVSAADMDPQRLKREFGDKLCFWGGIDTHRILPYGTPDEVREEVRRRIEELGAGGGYVISAIHNILAEVPPQNILAMAEAAHVYGRCSDGHRFRLSS
jgi:uroporphyrinogen decarboxylase